jgi:hypothetical protein
MVSFGDKMRFIGKSRLLLVGLLQHTCVAGEAGREAGVSAASVSQCQCQQCQPPAAKAVSCVAVTDLQRWPCQGYAP